MNEIDFTQIRGNGAQRDAFLEKNRFFILKTVSLICKKHIDPCCDEYSVALSAFNEAIDRYDGSGSFLPFAAMVMRTRLIDFFRKNGCRNEELIDDGDAAQAKKIDDTSVRAFEQQMESECRAAEIEELTKELGDWGITLQDLIKSSPKHKSKRKYIHEVISIIQSDANLLNALSSKKQLPLDLLEKNYHLPRKKLEPYRKYIIAGLIIRLGSYDYLRDYIR